VTVELLSELEAAPASYPAVMAYPHRNMGSSAPLEGDAFIDDDLVWQRIEGYIAWRWTPRTVTWTVAGPGEWTPRLAPVVAFDTTEIWNGSAWEAVTLDPSPLGGFVLAGEGPYRVTATVGAGTPPEAVQEAWRRLHEYSKGVAEQWRGDAAFRSDGETEVIGGWTGKALQLSGAADLLRPFRRA